MKLTKNHLFNILLWVIIILFMGVKSIEHTLKVHDDGVGVAIHEYSIQAQARMSHLINADYTMKLRLFGLTQVFEMMAIIKNTTDPYEMIQLNDELTQKIDASMDTFHLSKKDFSVLLDHQENVKQESLIFHSHAESFNRLIQTFPYVLLSNQYPIGQNKKFPSNRWSDC